MAVVSPAAAAPDECTDRHIASYEDVGNPLLVTVETTWTGSDYAKLRARTTSSGINETFEACWYISEGYYTFKSKANGKFVTAENSFAGDWEGVLRATATSVGDRERFRVTAGGGGTVHFSKLENVDNGRFVTAETTWAGDIKGILRARAVSPSSQTRFGLPRA